MRVFTSKELDKKIKAIDAFLPKNLKKLNVFFVGNEILFTFYNTEGEDVTESLRVIEIPDYECIFDMLYDFFFFVNDKSTPYFYKFNYNKIGENILNGTYFKDVRIKYKKTIIESVANIANWLNLDITAIYEVEDNRKTNCRVDFILKYSLFFKKPIFMFLNKKYAQEILSNMTTELEKEGIIDNLTANKIKLYYFKQP